MHATVDTNKVLSKIPTVDLIALAQADEENRSADDHAQLRSAIVGRTLLHPPKFNPAMGESIGVKDARRNRIKQAQPVSWDLPGHGLARRGCGWTNIVVGCENADYFTPVKRHCWRLGCPECWWDTTQRKAGEMCERLSAFDRLYAPSNPRGVWQHIVVSPPQAAAKQLMGSKEGYAHMRSNAIDLIRDLGIIGGVMVFHPFRENGEDDYNNRILTENDGEFGHWRTAPHFHVVGFGWMDGKAVKSRSKATGWVVKSIASGLDENARLGVVSYVLTHVGVGMSFDSKLNSRQINSYQYFGECVPARMVKVGEVESDRSTLCPVCNGVLYAIPIDTRQIHPQTYLPYKHTEVRGVYTIRENLDEVRRAIDEFPTPDRFKVWLRSHTDLAYVGLRDFDRIYPTERAKGGGGDPE